MVKKMAVSEKDKQHDAKETGTNEPKIRRGKVDSLTLYEITDDELNILERGSPSSTYLNFSIFFISVGLSFLTSLLTADVTDRIFSVFCIVTGIGFSIGFVLFTIWWRTAGDLDGVCKKIRERIAD